METNSSDKDLKAKQYAKTKRIISFISTGIMFAVLLTLVFTGLSKSILEIAYSINENSYIALLLFAGIIGLGESVITFPLSFYSGYILEHKYGLSNQSLGAYFIENLKGMAVGLVLGVPLLLVFYFILHNTGEWWWLVLAVMMFLVSVILGRLAPVLIFPLFYKFSPIEEGSLKERILVLCNKAGVNVEGIFTFNMSKNTKKANAAFTGMGKSKRIILGDTLVDNFTQDEIEYVFAHELGHYANKHIGKLIITSTLSTFIGLFLTAKLYEGTLGWFGYSNVYDLAALPLLVLYLSIYGFITTPINSILSRKYEYEADDYALKTTGNKEALVSTMEKLSEQNLSERSPNKVIEFLFHSHPSVEKRIEFARSYEL